MGGGVDIFAETTHYKFGVRYSSHSGIQYRYITVYEKVPDDNWHQLATVSEYASEEENAKLYQAFHEAEEELKSVREFKALTQEQLTLSHIWDRMTEAESQVKYWKQRAEKAETIVNDLDNWRREQEDKKWREKHES
jgi:hypothetical protein